MDYRQLGRSRPARLDPHARHHDHRRPRRLRRRSATSTSTAPARHIDLCLDAGVNLIDTADVYSAGVSEEIVGQALVGRRDRVLLATKARMPMGEGPNDAGLSRHHLIEALRGEPAAAAHRPHRPLPGPRVGRPDAAGGDARHARRAGTRGQGALRRLLQLRRLAARQGARDLRSPAPAALRQPADLLLAAGARGRVRARAGLARPGCGHPGLEPAGRRPALRQVPPRRPAAAGRHLSDWDEPPVRDEDQLYDIVDLAGGDRRGARRLGRPGRAGLPARQARGHVAGRRRAHRRAAAPTTSPPPTSSWRPTSARAWTRSARSPCSIPYWHQAKTASDRLERRRPERCSAAPPTLGDNDRLRRDAAFRTFLGGMTTRCQWALVLALGVAHRLQALAHHRAALQRGRVLAAALLRRDPLRHR